MNKPIILITNEPNLTAFDNDFTNHDVFDIVLSKEIFRVDFDKYTKRIKDLIDAYKLIADTFDIGVIIGTSDVELDYRFIEKLNVYASAGDVYMYCRTVYYTIIRSSGLLVGEDILAARLGVDRNSPDFGSLLAIFKDCKYTGMLSGSYDRWWFPLILNKWNELSKNMPLRRMSASDRVDVLKQATEFNLNVANPLSLAKSTNFWTICMETKSPLDPIDGFVLARKDLEPWQENEYVSLYGVIEKNPDLRNYLSPIDRKVVLSFEG